MLLVRFYRSVIYMHKLQRDLCPKPGVWANLIGWYQLPPGNLLQLQILGLGSSVGQQPVSK